MVQQCNVQCSSNEANINLAMSIIKQRKIRSVRRAAKVYKVSETTLRQRCDGISSRQDLEANSKLLTKLEEEVIIEHIFDLDSRGFSPTYSMVRDMANRLLIERGVDSVGRLWPHNFIKRSPTLKSRITRRYDYKRAKCEDSEVIGKWFELVKNMKAKYGIAEEDIYNFDKSGFQIGIISSQTVITSTERRNRPKALQPGDRE